jgi:hypothetical protein
LTHFQECYTIIKLQGYVNSNDFLAANHETR